MLRSLQKVSLRNCPKYAQTRRDPRRLAEALAMFLATSSYSRIRRATSRDWRKLRKNDGGRESMTSVMACLHVVQASILAPGLNAPRVPALWFGHPCARIRFPSGLALTEESCFGARERPPSFQAGRRGFESRLPL